MNHRRRGRGSISLTSLFVGLTTVLAGCSLHEFGGEKSEDESAPGTVTLAFAGDIHFENGLDALTRQATSTLGGLSRTLADADVAVVNLESAIATPDRERADKELENPARRFWFRTNAGALDVLERSGVDVASMANNHGADFGVGGIRDAVEADRDSAVELIGVGLDDTVAYAPYRTTVRDTSVAVHAADLSPLESVDPVWSAAEGSGPGIASARGAGGDRLVEAVRQSAETDDVVVVYLHWGEEGSDDPTTEQQRLATRLADAGADVVVGAHAHLPLGAGTIDSTYVSYGLGNFLWYHGDTAETGVLKLTVTDGEVVKDTWVPGSIPVEGGPARELDDTSAAAAVDQWRALRERTDLDPGPSEADDQQAAPPIDLPRYTSEVRPIGSSMRARMTAHDEGVCPVPLADLRHVSVSYVGFDKRAHTGELVVHEDVATDVTDVFATLYRERFPIRSMRLIDEYDGDDNRSMAANNSSGYNCRNVAGTDRWSNHAYGRAIDINPVQNPYVTDGVAEPPAGQSFADVDRSPGTDADRGVIVADDVVVRAFERVGWTWGDGFGDYQHFSADGG